MALSIPHKRIILFLFSLSTLAAVTVTGTVQDAATGLPMRNVNIQIENGEGCTSDEDGSFILQSDFEKLSITFTHIGYKPVTIKGVWHAHTVRMIPVEIPLPDITVSTTRVIPGVTPVSYSTLTKKEIQQHYSVEDVPMILASEPGVHSFSESGNGTGYSYMSIRGFDQSRIAVMIDNVPMNDNESHQVYWVDHGDILSDVQDIEIQRGVGNSLYGASAFGGSINLQTAIASENEELHFSALSGSYNTLRLRAGYKSGDRLENGLSFSTRISSVTSDGYRESSESEQKSFSLGIQHAGRDVKNEFRIQIGKEISTLQWDGVTREMLSSRKLRKGKMEWTVPFTDDFLQQIYSLNTQAQINPNLQFRNTAYFVTGSGFYNVQKSGADYFSYNLDLDDLYSDAEEQSLTTDLNRRKWIKNNYYGIVPILTTSFGRLRLDAGAEIRNYTGDHFGEVSQVSDSLLGTILPEKYRYYDYTGSKFSYTFFSHLVYSLGKLHLVGDLQYQVHDWNLVEKPIGHFEGHDITAKWDFFNPRLGFTYNIDQDLSVFGYAGIARKEPSDDQIIEGDNVYDTLRTALPEKILDVEFGMNRTSEMRFLKVNLYYIEYENEILSDIYDFEEAELDIETADKTVHTGMEFETGFTLNAALSANINGTVSSNTFVSGIYDRKTLTNTPDILLNASVSYNLTDDLEVFIHSQHVGKQFINNRNDNDLRINSYSVLNLGAHYSWNGFNFNVKINNALDELYATYGYYDEDWGSYYWPGATRNYYFGVEYILK